MYAAEVYRVTSTQPTLHITVSSGSLRDKPDLSSDLEATLSGNSPIGPRLGRLVAWDAYQHDVDLGQPPQRG
jgi:hypothetical protein